MLASRESEVRRRTTWRGRGRAPRDTLPGNPLAGSQGATRLTSPASATRRSHGPGDRAPGPATLGHLSENLRVRTPGLGKQLPRPPGGERGGLGELPRPCTFNDGIRLERDRKAPEFSARLLHAVSLTRAAWDVRRARCSRTS